MMSLGYIAIRLVLLYFLQQMFSLSHGITPFYPRNRSTSNCSLDGLSMLNFVVYYTVLCLLPFTLLLYYWSDYCSFDAILFVNPFCFYRYFQELQLLILLSSLYPFTTTTTFFGPLLADIELAHTPVSILWRSHHLNPLYAGAESAIALALLVAFYPSRLNLSIDATDEEFWFRLFGQYYL